MIYSTQEILNKAKIAKQTLTYASESTINTALTLCAKALRDNMQTILDANQVDVEKARGVISDVMIDRLSLNADRIEGMARGIDEVVALPSPVGEILSSTTRPNGLVINKTAVPLGVVAIIYESRPNVTSDAISLCLKSGNVCVLRGGKEAYNTSKTIVELLKVAIEKAGLTPDAINIIDDTSRESATALMTAVGYVDMLIPRGGAGLIKACVENATVPTIETGTGICHTYIDDSADIDMSVSIVNNAKTSRPSVCNAMEVLLVHRDIAKEVLPKISDTLTRDRQDRGLTPVLLKCDDISLPYMTGVPSVQEDYDTEFLDYVLAVKVVDSVDDAIDHINTHNTRHSECIISNNSENISKFERGVDASCVYVNASTRFTDGGEFGFGAEIGISTQKGHPRGPMGLKELCTYKYVIHGNGQVR
ncbi:MAG: glutamate-5-semialdehyde dehydrogenase [Clostridia bacterium]|nr:glutamate-5-semialdehyde dehydrogenase [Clostridia bacterium]